MLLPATTLPAELAADFARRVAERDAVPPPSHAPEAIAQRVDAWLLAAHGVRNVLARKAMTRLLLVLLAQPEASAAALMAAAGLGTRMTARHLHRLQHLGLTTHFYRRSRHHRLTRAGEDALLPVVQGVAL